jgi:3-phenylpropionate/trans-cinnamate dioxygenase ferredoxin reductase subunit
MRRSDVLIVGGGHAGAQTAIALSNAKFSGSVTILTDEPELPYERPPLSKDYLAGTKPFDRLLLRAPAFWQERGITIAGGQRVTQVDPLNKRVSTADRTQFEYGTLVWATGGAPRRLTCSGTELMGVHYVRNRADVDRMIAELPEVRHVVVIGGGYIGLEAASVLIKLGKHVTLLEMLPRILARVAGEDISRFFEAEHRAHGVVVRTNTAVSCIEGENGRVTGVRLADGEHVPAQMVIVGIGIAPAVEPLRNAGAVGSNGVDVDSHCRTSLRDVYAVGDCAAHENAFAGGARVRLESVQNANEQGATAAKAICGQPSPYHALPWFWSDQYDLKLQTIGLSIGHDSTVLRGDPATRSFSVAYLSGDRLLALDSINNARDYVQGRKLIVEKIPVDRAKLSDPAIALKDLAPAKPSSPAPG